MAETYSSIVDDYFRNYMAYASVCLSVAVVAFLSGLGLSFRTSKSCCPPRVARLVLLFVNACNIVWSALLMVMVYANWKYVNVAGLEEITESKTYIMVAANIPLYIYAWWTATNTTIQIGGGFGKFGEVSWYFYLCAFFMVGAPVMRLVMTVLMIREASLWFSIINAFNLSDISPTTVIGLFGSLPALVAFIATLPWRKAGKVKYSVLFIFSQVALVLNFLSPAANAIAEHTMPPMPNVPFGTPLSDADASALHRYYNIGIVSVAFASGFPLLIASLLATIFSELEIAAETEEGEGLVQYPYGAAKRTEVTNPLALLELSAVTSKVAADPEHGGVTTWGEPSRRI